MFVLLNRRMGLVGPYFIDEVDENGNKNLGSAKYIRLLREKVIPDLKQRASWNITANSLKPNYN